MARRLKADPCRVQPDQQLTHETLHQMHPCQALLGVPQIQPDQGRARHSMQSLPTRKSQDGRGQKHTFDAGQLGSRDDGNTTLNREGLFVKKTNDELLDDIRRAGMAIDTYWPEAFPCGGNANLDGLQQIESHANALHINCRLLRQRLEAQDPSIQHLRKTLQEGE